MDILGKLSQIENQKNILKEKFSLNYNPFPKSGMGTCFAVMVGQSMLNPRQ